MDRVEALELMSSIWDIGGTVRLTTTHPKERFLWAINQLYIRGYEIRKVENPTERALRKLVLSEVEAR